MTAPSYQEAYDLGLGQIATLRPELPVNAGDLPDVYLHAACAMWDKLIAYASQRIKETYLDGAAGVALTTLVDDHWAVQRQAATAAVVTLTFNRATASAGAGTIPTGTVVATEILPTGAAVQFTTDADVNYGAAEVGDKTVTATCEVVGREGNVEPATLTRILDALWDTSLTVTNAARAAGGNAEESDESLRERVRNLPVTQRRATLRAIEYGVKADVPTIKVATAIEDDLGNVTLYVADEDAGSNLEMIYQAELALLNWRAAGVVITVAGGVVLEVDVDFSLTVRAGFDPAAHDATFVAAITAAMRRLRAGDILYRSLVQAAVKAVDPDNILEVIVNDPTANIAPAAGQIIRAGAVTRS